MIDAVKKGAKGIYDGRLKMDLRRCYGVFLNIEPQGEVCFRGTVEG